MLVIPSPLLAPPHPLFSPSPSHNSQDVKGEYVIKHVLGRGQFGTTRLAESKKENAPYACKSIAKRKLSCKEDKDDVVREVQIMHHLKGHVNITHLKGAFEDRQDIHLVMDLCEGGELFDRIVEKERYTEKDAAALIRTIVSCVAHCHSMGVIHRDLKPENFLLDSKKDDANLKCTDFGLSVFYKPGQKFNEVVGSAYYVAPEVLRRNYGPECDIWSCGVILYILLSGVPPFWGETEKHVFDAIVKGVYDTTESPWDKISDEAKDCVNRMLEKKPEKRATAQEILQHPWMKENGVASDKPIGDVVLNRLNNFANMNKMKKQAMRIIANAMPAEEIAGLEAIFKAIDTDNSGTITAEELNATLEKKGNNIPKDQLEQLLKLVDVDASGVIDYDEFLAATMSLHQLNKEENLRKAFEHFDEDGSGSITKDELRKALEASGTAADLSEAELDAIIADADKDGDGLIDYEEFVAMMMDTEEKKVPQVKAKTTVNPYKAGHSTFSV